jgi:hypothetical protein
MHAFVLTMFVIQVLSVLVNLLVIALGEHGWKAALQIATGTGLAVWAAWLLWGAQ